MANLLKDIGAAIQHEMDIGGYIFLPAFEPKLSTIEIANLIGIPTTPWEGGLVQALEAKATAAPNTYSGNFGLGRFPVPPRYLVLRCQVGYRDVPTLILDGRILADVISRNVLARAIFKPRRPRNGGFELLRLYETRDDINGLIRWDDADSELKPASIPIN